MGLLYTKKGSARCVVVMPSLMLNPRTAQTASVCFSFYFTHISCFFDTPLSVQSS